MADDHMTSDELFAIFKGAIPTPVVSYLMNGGAKLDRGALEMVQAVREQATNDRIEAQAEEIEELKSWKAAEDAHHHKLRAEIERLRKVVKFWPTRSDYDSDKSFIDAHFNWETKQARAALGEKK